MEDAMWVRVGVFPVNPDQATNLRRTYNEQAIPKVRAYPGNLCCFLLEPTAQTEPFLVMTIWQDRAAADRYESSGAAAEVVSLVRPFFAGPPTLRSYESSSIEGLPGNAPRPDAHATKA
jgi:quinol monooxygenase YgiN